MKPKILLVDDEDSICNMVKLHFQTEGYLVYTASDADEAITGANICMNYRYTILPSIFLLVMRPFLYGTKNLDCIKSADCLDVRTSWRQRVF